MVYLVYGFLIIFVGFRVTINDETPTEVKDPCGTCDLDPLDPSNFENELDGFVDEQNELPDDREIIDSLNAEEKEDVEISKSTFISIMRCITAFLVPSN